MSNSEECRIFLATRNNHNISFERVVIVEKEPSWGREHILGGGGGGRLQLTNSLTTEKRMERPPLTESFVLGSTLIAGSTNLHYTVPTPHSLITDPNSVPPNPRTSISHLTARRAKQFENGCHWVISNPASMTALLTSSYSIRRNHLGGRMKQLSIHSSTSFQNTGQSFPNQ